MVEPRPEAVARVVDRVVAAPQDAPVLRRPVVVELVARVADALAPAPADRRPLRVRERLGHEDVVVHGHDVVREPSQQRRVGVRGQGHAIGARPAPRASCGDDMRRPRPPARVTGRALEHPHPESRGRPRRRPHASLAGSTRATPSRSYARPEVRRASRRVRAPAAASSRVDVLPDGRGRRRHAPPVRRAGAARRRRRARRSGRSRSRCRGRATVLSIASRFSWPIRSSVGMSSGQRSMPLAKPCVSEAATKPPLRPVAPSAARAALDEDDVAAGVGLLGQQGGPQAGEPGADDEQVGRARRRRARVRRPAVRGGRARRRIGWRRSATRVRQGRGCCGTARGAPMGRREGLRSLRAPSSHQSLRTSRSVQADRFRRSYPLGAGR